MKKLLAILLAVSGLSFGIANAAPPTTDAEGTTVVHLDEYNGYFAAHETLASLKPGKYQFVVSNKSGKLVGFQIQDYKSHNTLDMFPLEPCEKRTSEVTITENGVRYRCPINPTP